MQYIDAHHHLWDLRACHYPWLMARGVKRFFGDPTPIQKNYLVKDLLAESTRYVPSKSVHIQVGVDEADALKESQWLQQQADQGAGFPHAIVAYCDLAADDAPAQLDAQQAIGNLRGVRQIVGRHADEDRASGTGSLLASANWRKRLGELAERGLSFDLQLIPPQLDQACEVFESVPELKVALCHCGSPWDQTPTGLEQWRRGLERLAQLPNLVCKVSGLGMFNPSWSVAELRPIVLAVIDIFGPQRCMFGSNFPVDKLYRSYETLWDAYVEITKPFSAQQCQAMFYQNAAEFYRI